MASAEVAAPVVAPVVPTVAPEGKTPAKRGRPKGVGTGKHQHSQHPPYQVMIKAALTSLKDKKGSSRAAILKYLCQNYRVGEQISLVNARLRTALKRCVESGALKHSKGVGASGSFLLGATVVEHKKTPKKLVKKEKMKSSKAAVAKVAVSGKAKGRKGRPPKKGAKVSKKAAATHKMAKTTKKHKKRIAAPKPKTV